MNTAAIVTPEMLAGLPTPVRQYMNYSGVVGMPLVRSVIVKQAGRIRLGPEKRWMQFRATESYSVDPPSFTWDARVGYGRLSLLAVRDSYVDGKGAVRVSTRRTNTLIPVLPVTATLLKPQYAWAVWAGRIQKEFPATVGQWAAGRS